jgi:hypothetical protein
MAFPALEEVDGKIDDLRKKMSTVFDEAGPDHDFTRVKSVKGTTFDVASQVRKWNDELTDLGKKRSDLAEVEKAAERIRQSPEDAAGESGDGAEEQQQRSEKSFGELFTKSKAWTDRNASRPTATLQIGLKTLLTTTAGWVPEVTRNGRVVDFATRPIQVADIMPTTTTSPELREVHGGDDLHQLRGGDGGGRHLPGVGAGADRAVHARPEDHHVHPGDGRAAGGRAPDPGVPEQPAPVHDPAASRPAAAHRQRHHPEPAGCAERLRHPDPGQGRRHHPGRGVQGHGEGHGHRPGQPGHRRVQPDELQDIRLLRTADGIYIWGNPSDAGPERIWGLQVTLAQAMTAGTALVADLQNFSELSVRRGINVQISNSHSTFFIEGKQAVRCDMRAALIWYRPAALCTITGL